MQPHQARRGMALVTGSTLVVGVVLVVVALLVTACSSGATSSRPSAAPSSSTSASSGASSAAPSGATSAATTPPASSGVGPAPSSSPSGTVPGDTTGGLPVQPAVPIASPATFGGGVTSTVNAIEPITATASLPGEVAGPAVRLQVAIQNASSASVDLGNVVVDLQDAAGVSATSLSGNGSAPFTGSIGPGGSATGTYVFSLPTDDRTGVRLFVTVNATLPVVVFTGDIT